MDEDLESLLDALGRVVMSEARIRDMAQKRRVGRQRPRIGDQSPATAALKSYGCPSVPAEGHAGGAGI